MSEGVTDNIYIKTAVQALAAKYPTLISPAGDLKVKLFKYTKTSAAVQNLGGGTGDMPRLAREDSSRIKGLEKSGGEHPLIMVVDHDEGSNDIFAHVKHMTKKRVDGSQAWYYLEKNLYVVPIPMVGGRHTPIERLFEQKLLDRPYQGKTLDLKNTETDGAKFFSKKTFATKVVAADKATIKFDGFEPLLTAIAEVIEDYKTKVAAPVVPSPVPVAVL